MEIRTIQCHEISPRRFDGFLRHQEVTHCWRKIEGVWVLKEVEFTENWGDKEYEILCIHLLDTIKAGGTVVGAFQQQRLVGFVALKIDVLGSRGQYREIPSLHVSEDCRGQGIGRLLLLAIGEIAKAIGTEKLYLSTHSSKETQGFYHAMGCVEAEEIIPHLQEAEPCDCQLEFVL